MKLRAMHFIQLYIQNYFQLFAQLLLMLLRVSAVNYSRPEGATCVEDMYSMLYNLSNVSCKIFMHLISFY
jgi:hypothetical protein